MPPTRFWLIRHALVSEAARAVLYGRMDVELCPHTLRDQAARYHALAQRLPPDARWFATPLQRTRHTAQAIQRAMGQERVLTIEPNLTEQDLGLWQGLPHAELPPQLTDAAHPFWPVSAAEIPPQGESMDQVIARVGEALNRLGADYAGENLVCVSHGGAIRAAIAHAMGVSAHAVLYLAIQNLSLTVLERHPEAWRVVTVNEGADI